MANVLDNLFDVHFSRDHNRHIYWSLVSYLKKNGYNKQILLKEDILKGLVLFK